MLQHKKIFFYVIFFSIPFFTGKAQFVEDALRLIDNPSTVGVRALGMGNAFTGVADDFSAIYFNPGGLAQIRRPEFSFGLTNLSATNDATFLGVTNSNSNSNTILNNIGFVLPFPVLRGSMVFAVGYNRTNNYTGGLAFNAYNSQNSSIPTFYSSNAQTDLAWNLGLEDTLGNIPIKNNVQQSGSITESGGMNQWSFAGSVELMRNLSVGLTLGILSGSYQWDRTYKETDPNGLHSGIIAGKVFDAQGFKEFRIDESLLQDYSGWNATFGFLYNFDDNGRVGLSIKAPLGAMTVREDFSSSARSYFANGNMSWDSDPLINYTGKEYDISTPMDFTIGGSVNPVDFITISADAEFVDYTQLKFSYAPTIADENNFKDLNQMIKDSLRATINLRAGIEVTIPKTGLQLRGGFGYRPTPWKNDKDIASYNTKMFTFGVSYLFEGTFLLSVAYAHNAFDQFHNNYTPSTYMYKTDEKIANNFIMLSAVYRF